MTGQTAQPSSGRADESGPGHVYLLSSPVIDPAEVLLAITVTELTPVQACAWLEGGFQSAVGHDSTAVLLSSVLGIPVGTNRMAVKLRPGDRAVALKLEGRLPEGRVLSQDELRTVAFRLVGLAVQSDAACQVAPPTGQKIFAPAVRSRLLGRPSYQMATNTKFEQQKTVPSLGDVVRDLAAMAKDVCASIQRHPEQLCRLGVAVNVARALESRLGLDADVAQALACEWCDVDPVVQPHAVLDVRAVSQIADQVVLIRVCYRRAETDFERLTEVFFAPETEEAKVGCHRTCEAIGWEDIPAAARETFMRQGADLVQIKLFPKEE